MRQYSGLKNRKILIVDDVELNQHLAKYIMESWGCVVEIAENGARAVEKIMNSDFDMVLMDIQMPIMDGLQATRQIRDLTDEYKSAVPVVALTANALKGDCEKYIEAGMNDYLPKPYEEGDLYKIVSKNIRKEKKGDAVSADPVGIASLTEPLEEAPTSAMYNLSMIEAISGGDRSFIIKMLQLFLDTVPATLNDIKNSGDKGEWLPLSKHAHKLKSTIDSMGITALKEDIRFIETNGKAGESLDKLPLLVDKIIRTMHQVMYQVKKDHSL